MDFDDDEDEEHQCHKSSELEDKLLFAEFYVKLTGVSWERALDELGIDIEKILTEKLAPGTSARARQNAAQNLGFIPPYERPRDTKLYVLRIVCAPSNLLERVQTELSEHSFPQGRMDELITSDSKAACFEPDWAGSEYHVICARDFSDAWDIKENIGPAPLVSTSRRIIDWLRQGDFYCAKTVELDNLIAKLVRARSIDEVCKGFSAIDSYLKVLNKEEKEFEKEFKYRR